MCIGYEKSVSVPDWRAMLGADWGSAIHTKTLPAGEREGYEVGEEVDHAESVVHVRNGGVECRVPVLDNVVQQHG